MPIGKEMNDMNAMLIGKEMNDMNANLWGEDEWDQYQLVKMVRIVWMRNG